jgi:hypothetical protein
LFPALEEEILWGFVLGSSLDNLILDLLEIVALPF